MNAIVVTGKTRGLSPVGANSFAQQWFGGKSGE